MMFPFRREKKALDPRAKVPSSETPRECSDWLFERAHPCPRCDRLMPEHFSTRKLRSCRPSHITTKEAARSGSWYHERMKFWIGTSGFQCAEWRGEFYPEKLPASKMLPFYAERFPTTEINYTFRRTPSGKTIESSCGLTPEQFAFSLKAPQRVFCLLRKLRRSSEVLLRGHPRLRRQARSAALPIAPFLQERRARLERFSG